MMFSDFKRILISCLLVLLASTVFAQNEFRISGTITDSSTLNPVSSATIHLVESQESTLSGQDGTFTLLLAEKGDSLAVTHVGYKPVFLRIIPGQTNYHIRMVEQPDQLSDIVITVPRRPGKSFMEKVIEHKQQNNPLRTGSYSYRRYTRNELDIGRINYDRTGNRKGIKSLMLNTFGSLDTSARENGILPVYFDEVLADSYYSGSPYLNRENIIAKKNLGLQTDELLKQLDKFYFYFNIYDDWIPIFNQTYASPLNVNAFAYYDFFEGDSSVVDGEVIQEVRFVPRRAYSKSFSGFLQIDRNSFAITNVEMHLNKDVNLNLINNLFYSQEYRQVYDSTMDSTMFMPYRYTSEVKFDGALAIMGIPVPERKNAIQFVFRSTTVLSDIQLQVKGAELFQKGEVSKQQTAHWDKSNEFWEENRPEELTAHERHIYSMFDTLNAKKRFRRDIQLIGFAGIGNWRLGNWVALGPYTSFLSGNEEEGLRVRLGFSTLTNISKKFNFYGYGAYGLKDERLKGMLGYNYLWNKAKWTRSTISFQSDYDFAVGREDEMDEDNIISTMFRKRIPFSRIYIRQTLLQHEQYISPDWSVSGRAAYKEMTPAFEFHYHPLDPVTREPDPNALSVTLPAAEAGLTLRYTHNEKMRLYDYERVLLDNYNPIISVGYIHGFRVGDAPFSYNKFDAAIQQNLRLPPKSMLFYRVEAGQVLGTLPYLLLHIPRGNEFNVPSKYKFNTMLPYEFASDRFISLKTRFHLGGVLMDKIPFIRKLGWRERFSFNSFWGDMTKSNAAYNAGSAFYLTDKAPFMEASAGIENIFHILTVEYFRRLNYLNHPYVKKGGVYVGVIMNF